MYAHSNAFAPKISRMITKYSNVKFGMLKDGEMEHGQECLGSAASCPVMVRLNVVVYCTVQLSRGNYVSHQNP